MPLITDKFGKASIDTNYAIATTVKTTRTAGVTVLEAFDLSKFSADTPVFFITYKKTTDPVTGITSVTNLVSWKGLVNVGANTITNLTLAPGYADGGNAVGDFVECIPTSFWVNSMMDGIFVGINPDGTFKSAAVNKVFSSPQGFMVNGKIVRSVSSNNLTVAVKTLANLDPSVSDPVLIRIGDTIRSITSALSLTLNAGTNWFGSGASYFAAVEGDYFPYLIWNSNTSAVTLGLAREPDLRIFSDRDATSTNYGHLAITGTAPAATDEIELVGRFNAILGVTASFNWSLPATAIVINRPIYETRIFSITNTGDAGGTVYWQQRMGEKRAWGTSAQVSGNANRTITLPTGFFSAIHAGTISADAPYVNTNVMTANWGSDIVGSTNSAVFTPIIVGGASPNNRYSYQINGV